jgi:predicted nucleic acid-binding protein
VTALFDTSLLLDYLQGDKRAARALEAHEHRAISVITWLELMAIAPEEQREETRGFLYSFERLSISEASADEALRLMREHPGLPFQRALTWATARVNQLSFVTVGSAHIAKDDPLVIVPYQSATGRK